MPACVVVLGCSLPSERRHWGFAGVTGRCWGDTGSVLLWLGGAVEGSMEQEHPGDGMLKGRAKGTFFSLRHICSFNLRVLEENQTRLVSKL